MSNKTDRAARFCRGDLPAKGFNHRAHLEVAHTLLCQHDFLTALLHFTHGARALAARAGHPEAFNLTMTAAWLSLVAERMHTHASDDVDALLSACPELHGVRLLDSLYSAQRLHSPLARDTFLLPDGGHQQPGENRSASP